MDQVDLVVLAVLEAKEDIHNSRIKVETCLSTNSEPESIATSPSPFEVSEIPFQKLSVISW